MGHLVEDDSSPTHPLWRLHCRWYQSRRTCTSISSVALFRLPCSILFFLFLVGFATPSTALYVHSQQSSVAPVHLLSPRIPFCSPKPVYPLVGEALFLTTLDPHENYSGKILIYQIPNFNFVEDSLETLIDTAPLALVSISWHSPAGITQYERSRYRLPHNTFPVFEISLLDNKTFATRNASDWPLTILITGDEPNPYDYLYLVQLPALAACILFASGIVAVLALSKLLILVLRDGPRANLAQIVLAANLISMLLRCAWSAVDPFGSYGIYLYAWVQIGLTIPAPFCITGALIITLYWHEMMHQMGHSINGFLGRLFWPFVALSSISFGMELATAVVRGIGGPTVALFFADGLIYAIIILVLLVFFIITKVRLDRTFAKLNRSLNHGQKRLQLASNLVIAMGVFMFLVLVFLIIVGSGDFFWRIPVRMATATGVLSCMTIWSLLQVLIIRAPEPYWITYFRCWNSSPISNSEESATSLTEAVMDEASISPRS